MAAFSSRFDLVADVRSTELGDESVHGLSCARFYPRGDDLMGVRDDARGNETNGGRFADRSPSLLEQTKVHGVHRWGGGHGVLSAYVSTIPIQTSTGISGASHRQNFHSG